MTEHQFHQCDDSQCRICAGGLAVCDVCNGAEGSLPTHCPGRRMLPAEADAVYRGHLNYIDGAWQDCTGRIRSESTQ